MAFDDDSNDERPRSDPPLPPEDRLWRHPSELAGGVGVPEAWLTPATRPGPRRSMAVVALASACLTGAAVAMGVMWFTRPTRVEVREVPPASARPATTAVFSPAGVPSADLAKQMAPSLVRVAAGQDDQWTTGTGIRLDDRGTIAIATPLASGAASVMVTGRDGARTRATVVGSDPATGITILTVSTSDGPGNEGAALAAKTVTAEPGAPVAVIAASSTDAGGNDQRVVTAAISATGVRSAIDPIVLHDAVQLDRSVPDDAIGGMVVDADGHLVGIVIDGSGEQDLAVIVPAAEAVDAAKGISEDGAVRRAWLGVRAVDLTPNASELLSVEGGALLTMVQAGSPASRAGLRKGDVITSVDGTVINDASDLVVALRAWEPGETVAIERHRGTEPAEVDVTLGG